MNINTLHHRPLKDVHPFISKHYRYAVVGASANPAKYGNIVFFDLKNAGFDVTPVHPTLDELGGMKVVKSVRLLKPAIDVVVMIVPPTIALDVLDDVAAAGIKKVWFQPGSDSTDVLEKAKRLAIDAIGDGACIMVARRFFDK